MIDNTLIKVPNNINYRINYTKNLYYRYYSISQKYIESLVGIQFYPKNKIPISLTIIV